MAEQSQQICTLQPYMNCSLDSSTLVGVGVQRLTKASELRGDGLYEILQETSQDSVNCHRNCISTYTSKTHIKRHLSKHSPVPSEPSEKRCRRSEEYPFNFKEQCLFCGEKCQSHPDPRNPGRWRRVVQCKTADRGPSQKTFKESILETCDKRNDDWGNQVKIRLQGAISDLHAADGQYHKDCLAIFRSERNVQASINTSKSSVDPALEAVISEMEKDRSRIWNSVELHEMYTSSNGEILSRRQLIKCLLTTFGQDLLMLSGLGVASLLVFKSKASAHLKLLANDDDDLDSALGVVCKQISTESKYLKRDKSKYDTRINLDLAKSESSTTLLKLLTMLSSSMESSLPAAMVGNLITNALTNTPTSLQIALGVLVREKAMIEVLHDFGVTASYDEVLRFKASAAQAAVSSKKNLGISNAEDGLIQTVADNFDCNISSQNGLQSTHALAILLTQVKQTEEKGIVDSNEIRRLKKSEMAELDLPDVTVQRYQGPQKPDMPMQMARHSPLPLKLLARQAVSLQRAQVTDYSFLRNVLRTAETPEFNGFNTKLSREAGHAIRPKTKAVYLPLIDMTPSDPDTMLTAMVEAQNLTNTTGQLHTLFTNDQQLYRIAVNVTWVYPDQFENFIPRLGGMHTLMSFAGAVGTLMADSGLEEILQSAFGGVAKMMTGKKFPQNIRALRIVVEELLRGVLTETENIQCHSDLIDVLEEKASKSRTTKMWLDNLIKPVFTMMLFVRAEREGDWPLHLLAVEQMIPYFFSSGHFNYARSCLYYLRSMGKLPDVVLAEFLQGNHVMRHQPGIWNGIWSDLYIESTFMRFGHGPGGLIGITLKPSTMKRWALSLHICSQLTNDITSMREGDEQTLVTVHKEEMTSRKQADAKDKEIIREKLVTCIDPLEPDDHPTNPINIVSGKISQDSVNADKAVDIGTRQMNLYEAGWPESYHKPLSKQVVTMSVSRRKVTIGQVPVYDTTLIYSRMLGLQKVRNINLKEVLQYELSPVPPSMFDDSGDMRIAKSKASLKNKLQVEHSERLSSAPDAIILDGCAILWIIQWPTRGTVEDFIRNFVHYLVDCLKKCDVYLVFDRYYDKSIKAVTRKARAGKEASRRHRLSLNTPLPSQKVCLTVTENKTQIINLLCLFLVEHTQDLPANGRRLVTTGPDHVPTQIRNGTICQRQDLRTSHEEADVIITQQVVHLAVSGLSNIRVIADDTDIFVLLLHFYVQQQLTCSLIMQGTSHGRKAVDIPATVQKHADIIPSLLAAHVLSGCDTVSCLYGVGKGTVVKKLKSGNKLVELGNVQTPMLSILSEATSFVAACYGTPQADDLSDLRYKVWSCKMANPKLNAAPELRSIPPTVDAFEEHVHRAHLQVAIFKSSLDADPPLLNPLHFGWSMDTASNMLVPVPLPQDVSPAPLELLKMIRCGCSSVRPCATARCSCTAAQLSCSMFCACNGSDECKNDRTLTAVSAEEDDE